MSQSSPLCRFSCASAMRIGKTILRPSSALFTHPWGAEVLFSWTTCGMDRGEADEVAKKAASRDVTNMLLVPRSV